MAQIESHPDSANTVAQTVRNIVAALAPKYGEGEARAMARIIFENLKGWTPVELAIKANEHPSQFLEDRIAEVVGRIQHDEPIQYVFGVADFYGMRLKVTSDTLIPRPETAELVDMIVKEYGQAKDRRVLDLGTGSGCIAIALSRNLPFPVVTGVDVSRKALDVAEDNARALHADVKWVEGSMLALGDCGLGGEDMFDVIVSNPPYIAESEKSAMADNVLKHEPASALFVPDDDPLVFYKAILAYAETALSQEGSVWLEINPLFASELEALSRKCGFGDIELLRDSFGKQRFLRASRG